MAEQGTGQWRLTLDISVSRGLSGGHPETEGLTPDGQIIQTVPHEHDVTLNLTRYELGLTRSLSGNWDAFVRIPYFIKDQKAEVLFPNGGTVEEREAAIRNGYAHHRTELYEGFADCELGIGWKKSGLWGNGSNFRFSFGLAVPTGVTKPDPLVAGDHGEIHNHVQFGNGTFDPILDFYLDKPLNDSWVFSIYGKGRFPLYENHYGYRGSYEGSLIPRVTWLSGNKLSLTTGISANYYSYTEWSGRRDPNSGQFDINAILSASYQFNDSLTGSVSLLAPLYSKSFSDGEDSLDPAPTISISAVWSF